MIRRSLIVLLVAIGMSGQALAQGVDPLRSGVERRVGVGIAIPFGPRGTAEKPQLELRGTTIRHGDADLRAFGQDGWLPRRERTARVGLTLEQSPKFTIDGREMAGPSDRHNISTVGYIAIGVGLAVIVGGLLFADALNDASE